MDKDIKLINIFTKQALKDRDEEKYNEGWKAGNNYSKEQWEKEIKEDELVQKGILKEILDEVIEIKAINESKLLKNDKQTKIQDKLKKLVEDIQEYINI